MLKVTFYSKFTKTYIVDETLEMVYFPFCELQFIFHYHGQEYLKTFKNITIPWMAVQEPHTLKRCFISSGYIHIRHSKY